MKFLKSFIFWLAAIIYFEIIFNLFSYGKVLSNTFVNILIFSMFYSSVLSLLLGTIKKNKLFKHILLFIFGFYFSLQFVFFEVFSSYFSFSIIGLSNQLTNFIGYVFKAIIDNLLVIILLFIPFILSIILRKEIILEKFKLYDYTYNLISLIIILLSITNMLYFQKGVSNSSYDLIFNINENALNIEKLGVLSSAIIDIKRTIFGFSSKVAVDNVEKPHDPENELEYNVLNLDFKNTNDKNVTLINNYIKSINGTSKNEYTGIFEGYNLIYITAESFSEIGVREDLTPTLYKLVNSGFVFNNFYTPNNLSTLGGEFQSLTGLFANNEALPIWRTGENKFPFGLSNMFNLKGYNDYAYHNHYYNYQNRNKYLKSIGFDNYKGCYNGLEKDINCKLWPESDIEMIKATVDDYINNEPFVTYYMTVSGHLEYNFSGNAMAIKNKSKVSHLNYSNSAKAYLATQIELDKALELLIKTLDEKKVLDKTVIVLQADHYPYKLSLNDINSLSTYERDSVIEVNHNALIIWNPNIPKITIDKVCMSIDVIPTVYNLFGIEYDSRLFVGKDIFSDSEGLAMFANRSWVTDYGTYYANESKFVSNGKTIKENYIELINKEVNARMNISRLIVTTNYYNNITIKESQ